MLRLSDVPPSAVALGFAGLLPFLWGVGTLYVPALVEITMATVGPRFVGPFVILVYGQIILSFMSGVIWGFAAQARGATQAAGFALSVIPALWAFFFVGGGAPVAATFLIAGFAGLLLIDAFFWRNALAPRWWMALRLPLTAVVCLCLAPVAFG